jgi:hypothetical protein
MQTHKPQRAITDFTNGLSAGYEAMAMIGKGPVRNIDGRDIKVQARFIAMLFEVAAC